MIGILKRDWRLTALIAVAVLLLIAGFILYRQWQSAKNDQEGLEKTELISTLNLTTARGLHDSEQPELDKLRVELEGLKAQEAALTSGSEFPSEFPVVDLSNYLADGAPRTSITIVNVDPPETTGAETIGDTKYPTYETTLTVKGTLSKITTYLNYIETGPFTSIKVKNVQLNQDESGTGWTGILTVVFIGQS